VPPPSLLSEVRFGSFLAYSPRGTSDISLQSQRVTLSIIKQDRNPGIAYAVQRLVEERPNLPFADFFGETTLVVPAPNSTPRLKDALWSPLRICEELLRHGLAGEVRPCVTRVTAIRKSAFSAIGARPTPAEHLASLGLENLPSLVEPTLITVVDDVVTKGATLLAVASMVQAAYPTAKVRCFGFVRTLGLVPDISSIIDPCVGRIFLDGHGGAIREP
jgi:predicted amidophosphoribosyltransferase